MKTLILLPIIISASLNSYTRNLKDDLRYYQNPIANAGPDKTIYLTQTSTATLDGSVSSGDSYQWKEISTDFMSGGSITSPASKTTNVTGLKQGTFYFKLEVTANGITKADTMVVRVEYDVPPANSTLIRNFDMSDPTIYTKINNRTDTINHYGPENYIYGQAGEDPNRYYLYRARTNGLTIDAQKGKLLSLNEDGYAGETAGVGQPLYPRSELQLCDACFRFDTTKTYVFEWKGYFPQDTNYLVNYPGWARVLTIFQVHGYKYDYAISNFDLRPDGIYYNNEITGSQNQLSDTYTEDEAFISSLHDFYNKSHTLRVTMKEGLGYPGQTAFIKVELDGVQKYFRNTGGVGSAFFDDYVKFGSIYDWRSWLTSRDSLARGRKFSLITESFKVYQLNEAPPNIRPVADVGSDKVIQLPKNSIVLPGSGTDPDGSVISYLWAQLSGPATARITNADSAYSEAWDLTEGIYQFKLTVTDNKGATGSKLLNVTVNPAANILPTANAGLDKIITLPINIVSLSGSGTDSDGAISSYSWTKILGPSAFSIKNSSSATTDVSGLVQGVYQFELKVTDDKGATGKDTVQITVNAAPITNAGADTTIYLPTNAVMLKGKGNDTDGTVVSYQWEMISGPNSFAIANSSSAITNVTGLVEGIYSFELTVTDDRGAVGKDTTKVYVVKNAPPVANAGNDQTITIPITSVQLQGKGSSTNGNIISYHWKMVSGPGSFAIADSSSAITNVAGLVEGIYSFELTVTDDKGAIGKDVVLITVNSAQNTAPTADAGDNQSVTLPVNSVQLQGSGNDTDSSVVSYQWKMISGPESFTIADSSSSITQVTGLVQGVYSFELTVTDDQGAVGKDVVQIVVNPASNTAPVADAGDNQSVTLPVNSVQLQGSGNDTDGSVISYQWKMISGPDSFTIADSSSSITQVTGLVEGVYFFELTVTDDQGAVGKDVVQVVINPASNTAPVADAGDNQSVTLPVNSVQLQGSGNDADGSVVSYQWKMISGPDSSTIADSSSSITQVTGLAQGVYSFELTVTDDQGAIGKDVTQVTVFPGENINTPPVANAGSNQSVTLPVNSVQLQGSGNDADSSVVSYQWKMISGPDSFTIADSSSSTTQVTGLVEGVYSFELTVTDNQEAVGKDVVQIVVNPAPNIAPVADAGPNITITLPNNKVSLSGKGTDSDGAIASYFWEKIAGPSNYKIDNSSSANTTVSNLVEGSYSFQLTVKDNKGAIGKDVVQITVNPAPNVAPVADAGPNITITLPNNKVSLSGKGTDSDGAIASYFWEKIAGPSNYKIDNSSSANITVSNLVEGSYSFQLTVKDNKGAIGKDVVQITVNPAPNIAPVADAGPNITITLPNNKVSLSGKGTDSDGAIASYFWEKIAGPSNYKIDNSSSANTAVSNLVEGSYSFQLTVKDNKDAIGKSVVQVIVNPAPNIPPSADAGEDNTITLPANTVILSGKGTDIDGTIVSYKWTKIAGPSLFNIVNPALATTEVTGLAEGKYTFQLTVTDNKGAIGKNNVRITVKAANLLPVANAGSDKSITLPVNTATLLGGGTDPDGNIVSYTWTKILGPSSYNIVNPSSTVTNVSGLVQGIYQFELKVTDDKGAVGKDTVQVIVNAAPNKAPIANAGADKSITLPTNTTSLAGSGSDADGTIKNYTWTKVSGPSSYNIVNPSSPVTDVSGLVQGIYQFELKVTDDKGAIGKDTVQVIVNAVPNKAPTANAGADKSITLPTNIASLAGSGSDADGTIKNYTWTKISGPSSYNIVNPSSPVTDVSGLVQGVYQFELKVTDDKGAVGKDTVQITVNTAANKAPTANAGADKSITLPTNIISLAGSGSDADGTIKNFTWTKISGPSSYNIVNPSSPVTDVSGLVQGIYQFELKVTDDKGAVGKDTVQVIVNAVPNKTPTANAGADKSITLPTNTASLAGSGSDADGTIKNYTWTKISGPSSYNIVNPSSPVTDVSGLVQGVYQFELKVTDDKGAIGKDTVQVIVNAVPNKAPIANAGADKSITLPTNTASLAGSGSDADGTIKNYTWTKVSGPSSYNIVNPSSPVTDVSGLVQGVYQFELKVTDDKGAVGKDTVRVIVNAVQTNTVVKPNIAPVAQAGNDTTVVAPIDSITLTGTGTDEDGQIIAYLWKQISGPGNSIISQNNSTAIISNLIEGTYEFELTVKDNDGAESKDTLKVTVALGRFAREANAVKVYPNPVQDIATVDISTEKPNTNLMIIITDMSGKVVYKKDFVSETINVKNEVNMSNLTKGIYIITVFFDGVEKQSVKVVKL